MLRYLVFAFDSYYPAGGWNDFRGSYETPEEAVEAAENAGRDYWQVVDAETGEVTRED